jgi:nucleotide-binding universal stress UspA family protein
MLAIDDILVARDFSSVSDRALRHALDLAARTGATLHLLHADVLHEVETRSDERPAPGDGVDAFRERLKVDGTAAPEALDAVPVQEVTRRDVAPAPALLNYADEEGIDLIAMGTHGRRGPSRILLGSVAEEVVRRAQQPVLTVAGDEEEGRTPTPGTVGRLLVPIDFSDYSREALRYAHEWGGLYDAEIDVLHVVEEDLHPAFYVGGVQSIYDAQPDLDEKVTAKLTEFVDEVLGTSEHVTPHVATGSAPSAIATFVDEHAVDLVSLSTHGRTGMERFFLGSVAEKVVRHVSCPVLTVKAFGKSLVADSGTEAAAAEG